MNDEQETAGCEFRVNMEKERQRDHDFRVRRMQFRYVAVGATLLIGSLVGSCVGARTSAGEMTGEWKHGYDRGRADAVEKCVAWRQHGFEGVQ